MKKIVNILFSKRILAVVQIILGIVAIMILAQSELVPVKYLIGAGLILLLLDVIFYITQIQGSLVIRGKRITFKRPVNIISKVLQVGLCLALIYGCISVDEGTSVIEEIASELEDNTIEYSVVVLASSKVKKAVDLEGKSIGYYSPKDAVEKQRYNQIVTKVNDELKEELAPTVYDTVEEATNALYDKKVKSIVIQEAMRDDYCEVKENFDDETRIIKSSEILIPTARANKAKVTKEPFIVFVSGEDAYGKKISATSRSDVNMLAVINPVTKQVLLISIPRDYYVPINGMYNNDKLTHSGLRGIDCTVKTVQDFMDIKINYYAKVNYTSFMKIIDALGGITIDNPYGEFTSRVGFFTFKEGKNKLTAKQALAFVRERHSFSDGDFARNYNQQLMIKAVLKKVTSPSSILKLGKIFNTVRKTVSTNMSAKEIKSLINMEVDDMASWDVQTYSLKGYPTRANSFAMVTAPTSAGLSVVMPDDTSIPKAQKYIKKVMKGKIIKIKHAKKQIEVYPNANDKYMKYGDKKTDVKTEKK
ncbi:MAG: LCP family protein [Erysipelotrichaceae bacterium]|nr:LCP family protein [Erysipelotrichaceae bacterium]